MVRNSNPKKGREVAHTRTPRVAPMIIETGTDSRFGVLGGRFGGWGRGLRRRLASILCLGRLHSPGSSQHSRGGRQGAIGGAIPTKGTASEFSQLWSSATYHLLSQTSGSAQLAHGHTVPLQFTQWGKRSAGNWRVAAGLGGSFLGLS